MKMTLYFAKLNLISKDIFDLYNNPSLKKDISVALYGAVKSGTPWERIVSYQDDVGEYHSIVTEYSIHILGLDKSSTYLEGWVYKRNKLYYKSLDRTTNDLVRQSVDNTEGIRFALDLNHGYVGYNTTSRFGYKDFIESFASLINAGEEAIGAAYRYSISLCSSGLGLEDIKKELHSIGKIKELRIRMQPPNPSEQLLESLHERCDGLVQSMNDANVTGTEFLYTTNGTSGINIAAPLIDERIDDTQSLYSVLPIEESTKKGYVTIEATLTNGRKYTSGNSKPIKRIISSFEEFFSVCIDAFHHL